MTIRLAWKNIFGNRLRSGLTVLGIVIGITSVILLVGLVNGASQSIMEEMSSVGADTITISIYDSEKAIDYEDVAAMESIDKVEAVAPYTVISATISKSGAKGKGATVIGVGSSYLRVMDYELETGRDFSPIDVDHNIKAVIIGKEIANTFWKNRNPCGDTIKLDGDDYIVIGVLKSTGSSNGNNVDKTVMIPISTAGYLGADTSITELLATAENEDAVAEASKNIREYMQSEHKLGSDYMDVYTEQQMQEAMDEIYRAMSLLLGGIASISLLVGGIGVMNVMLVSVTERTREIGIRKSLGARKRDIMRQFLIESMVLSVFGGLIGILIGLLGGRLIVLLGFYFAPSIGMILLSFAVSVTVGLVFGILPARRAAGLRPVEALHYE